MQQTMGVALLLLIVVASSVALRRTATIPIPITVLTAPARQGVLPLAVDASSGHVYAALCGLTCTMHVLDSSGRPHDRTLIKVNALRLWPVVAPGTGHVFTLQSSPDSFGHSTRVDMFNARRNTHLTTGTIPLDLTSDWVSASTRGNTVVLGAMDNPSCTPQCAVSQSSVVVLDARSGRLRRVLHVPGEASAVGIDASTGRILVVASRGLGLGPVVVTVFNAVTGQVLQRRVLTVAALEATQMAVDEATGRAFVLASPVLTGPNWAPRGGDVFVLDAHTGALLRTIRFSTAPADVAIDRTTRHVFVTVSGPWRYVRTTGSGGSATGVLPVGTGSLNMLDARTGATLAAVTLGLTPGSIAVDERRGRVYVTHGGSFDIANAQGTSILMRAPIVDAGGVAVVDARSGQVLRRVTLGTAPDNLALDEHTQQLFIADRGSYILQQPLDPWAWLPAVVRQHLPFLPHPPASRPIPGKVLVLDTAHL